MPIKITVNGNEHTVEAGGWLIDVLNELGYDIPHFCYHPGLGPDGNCRMCQVEYVSDRGARLAISCNQPVMDGLNIVTNSDKVKEARAGVEEALLLNHPLDCPICDKAGECTLQNYYMEHDLKSTRQEFKRFKKDKAVDIGPTLMLDQERCVLCDRCVRFLRDWAGEEQLYIAGRGYGAYLTPFPGKPVDNPYSLNTYDLCPVGALTSKDFRFSMPPWFLDRTPSTCTSCARGCSMTIDAKKDAIYRLRPRHNPDVNGHWMCDEGRLDYKFVNTDRIKESVVDHDGNKLETSLDNGARELRSTLGIGGEAKDVAILASVTCTVEELFALKRLSDVLPKAKVYAARHIADGVEDTRLRRADRHPNLKGAELLGLQVLDLRDGKNGDTPAEIAIADGAVLLAVGFDVGITARLEAFVAKFERVALIVSRQSSLVQNARVVVPGLTFAEKDGLIVNFESHIQPLTPAFDNLWDRTPPWSVIAALIEAASDSPSFDTLAALRSAIIESEAAFAEVDLNTVGLTGTRLEGQAV